MHQLSNKQTQLAQVFLIVIGTGLPTLIWTFFVFSSGDLNIFGRIGLAVFSLVLGFSILYFSIGLYNVTFDRDFIYLSRIGKKEKINVEKIEKIKPGSIPFRFFHSNTYLMTMIYFDNQRKYKIHFLSKGATGIVGTVDHIPLLNTIRQFIKDGKYGV